MGRRHSRAYFLVFYSCDLVIFQCVYSIWPERILRVYSLMSFINCSTTGKLNQQKDPSRRQKSQVTFSYVSIQREGWNNSAFMHQHETWVARQSHKYVLHLVLGGKGERGRRKRSVREMEREREREQEDRTEWGKERAFVQGLGSQEVNREGQWVTLILKQLECWETYSVLIPRCWRISRRKANWDQVKVWWQQGQFWCPPIPHSPHLSQLSCSASYSDCVHCHNSLRAIGLERGSVWG